MKYTYLGNTYNIKIIRKNNKNTYIRFKDNEIVVSTNYFVSDRKVLKLIKDNKKFIDNAIDKSINNINNNINGFMLFGNNYDIIYNDTIDNVLIEEDKICSKDKKSLDKYLSNYIYNIYIDRLNYWSSCFDEKLPSYNLKIRKMKSRWGVCNIKNNSITLNLELSKYDIKYLDYVIIHELSHFIHSNHSKDFWLVVSKYCNNYKDIRKDMKKFVV